ncbi:MAG: IS200/IS605 family transposase [Phycisphaerales bacterium]|nr:IS200/IS605 family transposase [Phycisphaerales bacterium]
MPGTYSQLLMHIVFSTKNREPWIASEVAERLYPYMGGIIRGEKGSLLEIGGVADHIHLLIRWRPDESVSNLMRTLKSKSSLWIHQTFADLAPFAWQEGYSAFSVSKSQENAVRAYILNQPQHHAREDFKTELIRFLCAHEIEYDKRYVFD